LTKDHHRADGILPLQGADVVAFDARRWALQLQCGLKFGHRLGLAVGVRCALRLLEAQVFGGVFPRQFHQLELVAPFRRAQLHLHAAAVGQPRFEHGAVRRHGIHQDQAGDEGGVVIELLDEGADQRAPGARCPPRGRSRAVASAASTRSAPSRRKLSRPISRPRRTMKTCAAASPLRPSCASAT
jgi:hypothetical protein